MRVRGFRIVGLLAALGTAPALAQSAVYPAKGQSAAKQQKDESECGSWAIQQSGVAPALLASAQPAPQGQVARGTGRGAAAGAVGGLITGHPGRGAAIGAATGAAVGAGRKSKAKQEQEAQSQAAMASYERARTACLTGRGYTVQ